MALWMVRMGRQGEQEEFALSKGLAVIGWDEMPDLSAVTSREDLCSLYEEAYPDASKHKAAIHVSELWAFRERIREGDIVALPMKTRSAVALGEVFGPYKYDPSNPLGAKHTRPVRWHRTDIPRSDFGQDLLYSLGCLLAVCQIKRNNAQERIKTMMGGAPDPVPPATLPSEGQVESTGEGEVEPPADLETYAQDQIRALVGARFKGHELARLVTAILTAQGHQTFMSPPGPDGGVDIVAGGGPMGFDPPRLCVQVKSGGSPVGVGVLRELQGVMQNFGADQGLLVSWAGFKDSVYREARTHFFEIRLWDADKLVQGILESYDKLPDEIQAELPLKRIWVPVPEE